MVKFAVHYNTNNRFNLKMVVEAKTPEDAKKVVRKALGDVTVFFRKVKLDKENA